MRLIRQYSLTYSRPGSAKVKVYEVDLCEVGSNKYVVNYRYGRQGRPLHDGTRTISPISHTAAMREFDQLLLEKQQSGYLIVDRYDRTAPQAQTQAPAATPAPTPSPSPTINPPQHTTPLSISSARQHVLNPLWNNPQGEPPAPANTDDDSVILWLARHQGEDVVVDGVWPLARVAWRAGELQLTAAVPRLVALLGRSHGEDYALAWALGRCGGAAVTDTLTTLLGHDSPSVARIARSGLMLVTSDAALSAQKERLRAGLSSTILQSAAAGTLSGSAALERDDVAALYLLGHTSAAVSWLSSTSLSTSEGLACARTILQLAAHHDDVKTVALIAALLEGRSLGTTASGARRLRARAWRLLDQLHADENPLARTLAMELLSVFSDESHPHAGDAKRRLHGALGHAFSLLEEISDTELVALMSVPCERVSSLALEHTEERLIASISLPLLGTLFSLGGAPRALGASVFEAVDAALFRSWVVEQTEALTAQLALVVEAAVHWDAGVRAEARLLLGQMAPGMATAAVLPVLLRACAAPTLPQEAAFDGVETAWNIFPAALRAQPTDALVSLMRPSGHPLNGMVSTLLVEREDIPLVAAVPALCEGGEPGVLVGLSALEGADDGALSAINTLEQGLLVQRLKLLYTHSNAALRSRVLLQLARLLLLGGHLDAVISSQNADQVS